MSHYSYIYIAMLKKLVDLYVQQAYLLATTPRFPYVEGILIICFNLQSSWKYSKRIKLENYKTTEL